MSQGTYYLRDLKARIGELERQLAEERAHLALREKCSAWYEARVATLEHALLDCRRFLQPVKGNERFEHQQAIIDAALAPPVAPDAAPQDDGT